MSMQAWALGLALVVAGYAWHDALRARFPWAARAALASLLALGGLVALLNLEVQPLAWAYGAAPALGWSLRLPRADDAPPARILLDAGLGVAYAGLVALVGLAWSFPFVAWCFVAGAALVALRVMVVDPLLARRAARMAADGETAPPTTVK